MTMPYLSRPWLPWARLTAQSRLRLLLFPFAGGGASLYRTWLDSVPADIDILPVQLPGRETRITEPPLTRLEDVTDAVATALEPLFDRPVALFGWSMGALVAYSLALRLTGENRPPTLLMVGAHAAPQLPALCPPLHGLRGEPFWRELCRYQGVPAAVLAHDELRALLEPMLRADFQVVETRRPPRPAGLGCPVAAFGGLDDPLVPAERLRPWSEMTRGPFSLTQLPGNHFLIAQTPEIVRQAVLTMLSATARPLPNHP